MLKLLLKIGIFLVTFLILQKVYAVFIDNSAPKTQRIVLIEGIGGGLGTNLLTPEILNLDLKNNQQIKFYGTDFKNNLTARGKQAIEKLCAVGMIFINKEDPVALKTYTTLRPDYVYIATPPRSHIKLAKDWLNRSHPPKVMIVEKPFTENLREMQNFVAELNRNPAIKTKIYAIDHANAFNLTGDALKEIRDYLGTISDMSFFWIQNHSGSHKTNYLLEGDDRPITRENRLGVTSDEKRMVFDTLIHFFVPAQQIIRPETIEITDIKASQYERAEISGETFVAVRGLLQDRQNSTNKIVVTLYAGKGIGGVDSLGIKNMAHMLILRNKQSKEVRLSLDAGDYAVYFSHNNVVEKHLPLQKIYTRELSNLFFGHQDIGQSPQYTLQCLQVLDKIKNHIDQFQKTSKLPCYRLGTTTTSAPSLEEVLQECRVYGKGEDLLRGQELIRSSGTKVFPLQR